MWHLLYFKFQTTIIWQQKNFLTLSTNATIFDDNWEVDIWVGRIAKSQTSRQRDGRQVQVKQSHEVERINFVESKEIWKLKTHQDEIGSKIIQ